MIIQETKEFTPVIRGVKGAGQVSIVLATLGEPDHDGDVTLPGFFGRQTAAILPSHDFSSVPLGKAAIREQGSEAVADLQFNLKIDAAADWFEAIRYDFENGPSLQQYSYGFSVLDGGSRPGNFKGGAVRYLQPLTNGAPGVAVHEISPVLLGAGLRTRTLAVKGRHGSIQAELRRIYEQVTHDELKAIYEQLNQDMQCAADQAVLESAVRAVSIAYAPVADGFVLGEVKESASKAVEAYAGAYGLDADDIRICWFAQTHTPDEAQFWSLTGLKGLTHPSVNPTTIHLNSTLSVADAHAISVHELAHLGGQDETGARFAEERARFNYFEDRNI